MNPLIDPEFAKELLAQIEEIRKILEADKQQEPAAKKKLWEVLEDLEETTSYQKLAEAAKNYIISELPSVEDCLSNYAPNNAEFIVKRTLDLIKKRVREA